MSKVNLVPDIDVFDEDMMDFQVKSRPTTPMTLSIPNDVLESLQQMAIDRKMSLLGLLKLYIGKGLRQDRSRGQSVPDHSSTTTQSEIVE